MDRQNHQSAACFNRNRSHHIELGARDDIVSRLSTHHYVANAKGGVRVVATYGLAALIRMVNTPEATVIGEQRE